MKLQATVTDTPSIKSGTSKAGKPYSMREQPVLLELGNGERRVMALLLEETGGEFAKGHVLTPKDTAAYIDGYDLKVSLRARDWQKAA